MAHAGQLQWALNGRNGGKGTQRQSLAPWLLLSNKGRRSAREARRSIQKNEDKRKELGRDSGTSVQIRAIVVSQYTFWTNRSSPELEPSKLESNKI